MLLLPIICLLSPPGLSGFARILSSMGLSRPSAEYRVQADCAIIHRTPSGMKASQRSGSAGIMNLFRRAVVAREPGSEFNWIFEAKLSSRTSAAA
jgi:hypothetical protein